jgi:hypothetical protein
MLGSCVCAGIAAFATKSGACAATGAGLPMPVNPTMAVVGMLCMPVCRNPENCLADFA